MKESEKYLEEHIKKNQKQIPFVHHSACLEYAALVSKEDLDEYKKGLIKELRDLPTFKIVTVGPDKNRMIRGVYSAIDFKKQAINLINTPE